MRQSLTPASEADIKGEEGRSAGEGGKAVQVGVRVQKEGGVTGLQTRDKSCRRQRH